MKVLRKLREAHGELAVSARTARRDIRELKTTVTLKQERYDEPVLDMVPGVQCQVDGGELRGELKKKIASLLKFDLLIIDELGYLPMISQGLYNLFQLINGLYEYRSVILTTNRDFTNCGEFFRDENVAVPIVDRLIHHSHVFMLGGESDRLKQKIGN